MNEIKCFLMAFAINFGIAVLLRALVPSIPVIAVIGIMFLVCWRVYKAQDSST